jgi:predicted short-subunit dehydrogenase-like oxidoreductase (DUF2520 family)
VTARTTSERDASGSARALAGLELSLVGPGRAGSSVARWLLAAGARLMSVAGRAGRPLPRWAAAAATRRVPLGELSSGGQGLLLVAVPDSELAAVAAQLAPRPQAEVALHLSGALGGEVLGALRAGGTQVGAFHPLRAFPRPLPAAAVGRRTFFALDGDPAALALGARLAAALGAPAMPVPAPLRPLYHLAATWAAGGVVTVTGAAAGLHRRLGLPPASAAGLLELARGSLAAASPEHPAEALTGPVARGEARYLDQLDRLRREAPELHPLAVLLAVETLRQLAAAGPLSEAQEALRKGLAAICRGSGFLDPLTGGV